MKKEEILSELSKDEILAIHEGVTNAKETTVIAKENLSQAEKLIREEIAKAIPAYKKDGTTLDLTAAPSALVKSALEVINTNINKLEEKLAKQDEIMTMMQNGNIPKGIVESYEKKTNSEKESKKDEKDAIANLKSIYPGEIVDAVALIVDKKIKEDEEDNKEDNGKSSTKADKNIGDPMETIKGVLQILNER